MNNYNSAKRLSNSCTLLNNFLEYFNQSAVQGNQRKVISSGSACSERMQALKYFYFYTSTSTSRQRPPSDLEQNQKNAPSLYS